MYLLNRRFQQHQQIIWQGQGGVQDRTIYEDSVFAKVKRLMRKQHWRKTFIIMLQVLKDTGMMEEREYETYRSLFSNMSNFMWAFGVLFFFSLTFMPFPGRSQTLSCTLTWLQRRASEGSTCGRESASHRFHWTTCRGSTMPTRSLWRTSPGSSPSSESTTRSFALQTKWQTW